MKKGRMNENRKNKIKWIKKSFQKARAKKRNREKKPSKPPPPKKKRKKK